MSATYPDTTADAGPEEAENSTAVFSPASGARAPIWPTLVVLLGLVASLAWTGFLVWAVGRLIGLF